MEQNIEKLFKTKFENYSQKPPSNLWNKIHRGLKKKYFFKTFTIITSAIIIITTVVLFLGNQTNVINKPEKSDKLIVNNRQIEQDNNIANENIEKDNVSDNNEIGQKVITAKSNVLYVDLNSDSAVLVYKPIENKDDNNQEGFALSPNYGCTPLTVRLENSNTDYEELKWIVNNKEYKNTDIVDVEIDKPGKYEVLLYRQDNGTSFWFYDSIFVEQTPVADFEISETPFVNKKVVFDNLSFDAQNYIWFVNNHKISNEFEPTYVFENAGTYKITLIALNGKNCSDTVYKNVSVEIPAEKIVFPSAFKPNIYGSNGGYYSENQRVNEVFHPVVFQDVVEFEMEIYNRQGLKVFETNNINIGWDGYYKNTLVNVDVYVYYAKGKFADGEDFSKQGSVTVIYEK